MAEGILWVFEEVPALDPLCCFLAFISPDFCANLESGIASIVSTELLYPSRETGELVSELRIYVADRCNKELRVQPNAELVREYVRGVLVRLTAQPFNKEVI